MATVTIPFTFVNNTQNADATQVNSNFSTLASFLNTEVIQRDASVAFTQIPTLPSTTPTLANHATRKGYVDSFFPVATANIADSAVTSAKIADGAIVNADVNASAAIAYSKLALGSSLVVADFATGVRPIVICTNGTRPTTGLVEGQMIYETDTDRVYVYDGTNWVFVAGQAGASVTGSATIATGTTSTLTYNAETFDPDNIIPASGSTFTIAIAGVYAFTIDIASSVVMNDGFGSKLALTNSTRTLGCQLFGTETSVTWVLPMSASATASFSITNGTGSSMTATYGVYVRLLGR